MSDYSFELSKIVSFPKNAIGKPIDITNRNYKFKECDLDNEDHEDDEYNETVLNYTSTDILLPKLKSFFSKAQTKYNTFMLYNDKVFIFNRNHVPVFPSFVIKPIKRKIYLTQNTIYKKNELVKQKKKIEKTKSSIAFLEIIFNLMVCPACNNNCVDKFGFIDRDFFDGIGRSFVGFSSVSDIYSPCHSTYSDANTTMQYQCRHCNDAWYVYVIEGNARFETVNANKKIRYNIRKKFYSCVVVEIEGEFNIFSEQWFDNKNKLHRLNGPAYIEYHEEPWCGWYLHGQDIPASFPRIDLDGNIFVSDETNKRGIVSKPNRSIIKKLSSSDMIKIMVENREYGAFLKKYKKSLHSLKPRQTTWKKLTLKPTLFQDT